MSGDTFSYQPDDHDSDTTYSDSDDDLDGVTLGGKIRVYDARFKIPA